ncbi:hypothetical protein Tco_0112899, partial [Tanacetum coccineum]
IMNPQETEQVIAREELWVPTAERVNISTETEQVVARDELWVPTAERVNISTTKKKPFKLLLM